LFFIWLTIALIIISFAVYNARLRLNITYKKLNDNDVIIAHLSTFYGIIRYKIEMPLSDFISKINNNIEKFKHRSIKRSETKPKNFFDFFDIIENFTSTYKLYKKSTDYLIKKIYIKDFSINIEYGFNDAYIAAICYGFFYILITNFLIYIQSFMNLHVKDIMIKPEFNKEVLNMEFNCIIGIKIGHIISALKMFIKSSKGSEVDGTAYRRSYENNYGKY